MPSWESCVPGEAARCRGALQILFCSKLAPCFCLVPPHCSQNSVTVPEIKVSQINNVGSCAASFKLKLGTFAATADWDGRHFWFVECDVTSVTCNGSKGSDTPTFTYEEENSWTRKILQLKYTVTIRSKQIADGYIWTSLMVQSALR